MIETPSIEIKNESENKKFVMFTYSIIIPHYNTPLLLQRMLNSIPEREDIQVIVVDDCSKGDQIDLLKACHHKNIEIYYEKENRGAGHARNVGLDHAKGRWVLVVDADDIFAPDAFGVLDKYINYEIDYLCYRILIIDVQGNPVGQNVSDKSVEAYLKKRNKKNTNLFKYKNYVCWNKMVSSDFIKRNHIQFEECKVNNDVYYNLMIAVYADKFMVIPDILYHPIGQENSITKRKRTIEREFEFYLQAQKRNGFYKKIGLNYMPFYRPTILYFPYLVKKHNILFAIRFFVFLVKNHRRISLARSSYLSIFEK